MAPFFVEGWLVVDIVKEIRLSRKEVESVSFRFECRKNGYFRIVLIEDCLDDCFEVRGKRSEDCEGRM